MIRFEIRMVKAATILEGHGMIECVIAPGEAGTTALTIVVYVAKKNEKTFENLLDGNPLVAEYFTHPAGHVPGRTE